jgi:uncharacterized protein YodC (DUF2158 family)
MKLGDVVYLKSGSQPMTVTKIDADNGREEATCDWDGGSRRYPVEALVDTDPRPAFEAARAKTEEAREPVDEPARTADAAS